MATHLWSRLVSVSNLWRQKAPLVGTLLLAALCLNACSTFQGEDQDHAGRSIPCFDGDWRGTMKAAVGAPPISGRYKFRIVIHGHTALAYEFRKNQWREIADNSVGTVRYQISEMGDLYVVNWVNQDVIWTEEQTYSLSYINPTKLKIVQLRHVTNREKGKDGAPWYYVYTGTLTKSGG